MHPWLETQEQVDAFLEWLEILGPYASGCVYCQYVVAEGSAWGPRGGALWALSTGGMGTWYAPTGRRLAVPHRARPGPRLLVCRRCVEQYSLDMCVSCRAVHPASLCRDDPCCLCPQCASRAEELGLFPDPEVAKWLHHRLRPWVI